MREAQGRAERWITLDVRAGSFCACNDSGGAGREALGWGACACGSRSHNPQRGCYQLRPYATTDVGASRVAGTTPIVARGNCRARAQIW
ncbi:MAG: hypothetical protein MZV49_08465 [Rhodopseudomonas palustris]|nr:hypothetical protein [Rhodopseudomonas palustris]